MDNAGTTRSKKDVLEKPRKKQYQLDTQDFFSLDIGGLAWLPARQSAGAASRLSLAGCRVVEANTLLKCMRKPQIFFTVQSKMQETVEEISLMED
jgi:hypothetical protein